MSELLPLKRNLSFPQELNAQAQKFITKRKAPRISETCKDSIFTDGKCTLLKDWKPSSEEFEIKSKAPPRISEPDDQCTLIKCVQYTGIDKDEHVEIQEAIDRIKAQPCLVPEKEEYFQKLKLTGLHRGEDPIRAGPVFQVISVRLVKNFDSSWNKMDIYGEITVTDDKDNTFFIYKRESHQSEEVSPQSNSLRLTGCPIAPLTWGNVKIDLTYKGTRDVRIFAETRKVDYSVKNASGDVNSPLVFFGECGYLAFMEFTFIPIAFIAKVDIIFFMKHPHHPEEEIIDLDGQIKVDNVVCFEKQSFKFIRSNRIVEMPRNVFALPVNTSHLLVEFLLHRGGTDFVKNSLEIEPGWLSKTTSYLDCKDEKFGFKVHVEWILHECFFDPENQRFQEHVKWSSDHLSMDYQIYNGVSEPDTYVEVFSVFVGGNSSDRPLVLLGTILVQHRDETVYIFSRSQGCPYIVSMEQPQTISLAWSAKEWVVEKDFHMNFKLKDFKGLPLCRGSLIWPDHWDWDSSGYDRRKCDVIRSDNSYFVAVHYSIFRNGKKAKVTVDYKGPYRHLLVYGSIFAEYDNYAYYSTYDQDYYRIIIFKKSKEDYVEVKNFSEMPLSKSNVSAPSDCKVLTVEVKLVVCPSTDSPEQLVSIRLPFKADRNDVFNLHGVNLHGSHLHRRQCRVGRGCVYCCITMTVEWPKFS